jgi:hypothetical protein
LKSVNYGGRYEVRAADVGHLSPSGIARREIFSENGNRVLLQFVLARDAQEQLCIPDKAKDLAKQFKDHRMLFVTLPEVSFCRDNANAWNEFIENNARLALATDSASKKVFETQINGAKAAWYSTLTSATKLIVYKPNVSGEPFVEEVTWGLLKKEWLMTYVKQVFDACTDDLSGFNSTAFAAPMALQSWALAGMEFDKFAKPGAWKTVVANWQKGSISGDETWFDKHPNHPLTVMRDFCKKRQDTTVGAGKTCSIRRLYIDLQRPPFGLLGVPHSAFVLGFVLKTWLTGRRKLQWTDGVTSRALDAQTLAEIIEAVVKDDSNNAIKNEKVICLLSKEEKAFIEQSSVIFGNNPLADGTVEAALSTVSERLERISQKVPLWVLPNYIRAQDEPSAEVMGQVIDALCAANSISSKGDTETRGNKVKEIGATLLATPGLAEAMKKYMTSLVFAEAFQHYVDSAKPELKMAAERLGDASNNYCASVKNRFAETSGWLWKPSDAEAVLEEIYRQTLCAEHIRGLAGSSSGYMNFEDALNCLRRVIYVENKVPPEFWTRKHPALQRFFELLGRSTIVSEDAKSFEEIISQQNGLIRELFFDTLQTSQLAAMKEIFGEIWPLTVTDGRALYDIFPQDSAKLDEQSFKSQGRTKIEEYNRTLVSKRVVALWRERTGTDSPDEWSRKHGLPAECVLEADNARNIVEAVSNPASVSAERLQEVCAELDKTTAFSDVTVAGEKFLKRVLPAKYQKLGFAVDELSDCLRAMLDANPNQWLTDSRLNDTIEEIVRKSYQTHMQTKAEEKINALTDADAKRLLLKLIAQIPDAGFSVLEEMT